MTLKTFLKTKDKSVKVRIQLQLSTETQEVENVGDILGKAHLFDVVKWNVQFDNYEPLVVVIVK